MSRVINRIGLPDEEYAKIFEAAKKNRHGVKLKNAKGLEVRFFVKDKKLFGEDKKGNVQECMSMSDAMADSRNPESPQSFRSYIHTRLRREHPDMPDDVVDIYADILDEANNSIKSLIAMGVDATVASTMIVKALTEDGADEIIQGMLEQPETSPLPVLTEESEDE